MFQAGIEGFYLLRGIPHSEDRFIPPQEFPDNARERILACLACVNATFSNDIKIKAEWNDWARFYLPATNSADDYVQRAVKTKWSWVSYSVEGTVTACKANIKLSCVER